MIFNLYANYVNPIGSLLNVSYFFFLSLLNSKLLPLLNSFQLNLPPSRFYTVVLVDHLIFIIAFKITQFLFIFDFSTFTGWVQFLIAYLAYYLYHKSYFIVIGAVHYYKYATLVSLRQLVENIPQLSINQIESTIRLLSRSNSHLSTLLSIPLSIIFFMQVFNVIIVLSMSLITNDFSFQKMAFISHIAFYLTYLTILDFQIDSQLKLVTLKLKEKYLHFNSRTLFTVVNQRVIPERSCNLKVLVYIDVYRRFFCFRLFNCCKINYQFNLTVIFFVVNYVVLLLQTNA